MKAPIFFLLIILEVSACQQTPTLDLGVLPSQQSNTAQLFPKTTPLSVETTQDEFGFPVFDLKKIIPNHTYIVVFKTPIQLSNTKESIINWYDMVWHWHSGLRKRQEKVIYYADGQAWQDGEYTPLKPLRCLAPEETNHAYYWAAWSWNPTGSHLQKSTPQYSFHLKNTQKGTRYRTQHLIADVGQDQLVNAGESITLSLVFENSGTIENKNTKVLFKHDNIPEFPKTIDLGTLKPQEQVSRTITFTTPSYLNYGDNLQLPIEIRDKDCYSYKDTIPINTNGRRLCIKQVLLRYDSPKGTLSDDSILCFRGFCFVPVEDMFYEIYEVVENQEKIIKRSQVLCNNFSKELAWNEIPSFCNINANNKYVFRFMESDVGCIINDWSEYDFLGEVAFHPKDAYSSFPTKWIMRTENLWVELSLSWE